MIQVSQGPPVVFGMGQAPCDVGTDPTCGAGGNLAGALTGLQWLAIAAGAYFLWGAFMRGRNG